MICPCKGCSDRNARCHSVCEKYAQWKTEYSTMKSEYNKKYDNQIGHYIQDQRHKSLKRNHKNNRWKLR